MRQRLILALLVFPFALFSAPLEKREAVGSHPYFDAPVSKFYGSIEEMKNWFQKREVPISIRQISTKSKKFCFLTVHPYSGANSLDLYCYRFEDDRWTLSTLMFLTQSKSLSVDITEEGKFLNVVHDHVVVLKIAKD